MSLQGIAKQMFGDRYQEMLAKRAEMTEEQRNEHLLKWYGGTPENVAMRRKVLYSLDSQFDIVELKLCTCKSCGVMTPIPIYDLEYCSAKKYDGADAMGKTKFKEYQTALGYDRLVCNCCADGAKAVDNASMIVSLLVHDDLRQGYESVINSQKSNAVIPDRFSKYTFQNWKAKDDKDVKKLAEGYADRVVKGSTRKLLVSETEDNGATYVGVSILNKLCVGGKSVRYIEYAELAEKIFSKEYQEYLANCDNADVVMINGLTESSGRVLQRIFDMMQKAVLIFTTSEKGAELKNKIGDKYFSLFFDNYELIKITNKIEVTQ